MQRRRLPGMMEERVREGVSDVFRLRREARGAIHNKCNGGFKSPGAPVVSGMMQRPEQNNRQHDVEKGEQPRPERIGRVEKIFRPPNQMMASSYSPCGIQKPDKINQKRSYGLAGNQKHAVCPKADAGENHGNITEMQKIGEAPIAPIDGEP